MSKRTLFLITGLFVVTAILVVLAIYKPKTQEQTTTSAPKAAVKETVLTITPLAAEVATGSAVTASNAASVNIITGKNKVTAVQLELSFDPNVLGNVDLELGTFFKTPAVLLKDIDQVKGKIIYAFGINPGENGIMGSGQVAKITYQSKVATPQKTTIKFLPTTQATAEGETISIIKAMADGVIDVGPNSAATTVPLQPFVGTSSAQ